VTQRIALSWGSWGCRKVTLIPSPLKWPPQASLGAFPSTVWKNWRWGIHGSTPQPRVKNTVNRNWKWESSRRLFPGANLVVRPALPSGKLTFFFLRIWLFVNESKFFHGTVENKFEGGGVAWSVCTTAVVSIHHYLKILAIVMAIMNKTMSTSRKWYRDWVFIKHIQEFSKAGNSNNKWTQYDWQNVVLGRCLTYLCLQKRPVTKSLSI